MHEHRRARRGHQLFGLSPAAHLKFTQDLKAKQSLQPAPAVVACPSLDGCPKRATPHWPSRALRPAPGSSVSAKQDTDSHTSEGAHGQDRALIWAPNFSTRAGRDQMSGGRRALGGAASLDNVRRLHIRDGIQVDARSRAMIKCQNVLPCGQ